MAQVTLKGNVINTSGELPAIGESLPEFCLVKSDLSEFSLSDFSGKQVILNIFPSIDTDVCAASARKFNDKINNLDNTVVVCVSMDLPFAHKRFCDAEGLDNIITASSFRETSFGENFGVRLVDGPLMGLFARAILITDAQHKVVYQELVPEITQEPNYDAVMSQLM